MLSQMSLKYRLRPINLISGRKVIGNSFHTTRVSQLLQKQNLPSEPEEKKPTRAKILNAQEERLNQYRLYRYAPKWARFYIGSFLIKPVGFGISFVVLHELTAIIPFVGFWYLFMKLDWVPFELPADVVEKGRLIISKKVSEIPDEKIADLFDKARLLTAGANSYALTKLLLPFRIPLCFLWAPWFEKKVVEPVVRVFRKTPTDKKESSQKTEIWEKDVGEDIAQRVVEKPKKRQ